MVSKGFDSRMRGPGIRAARVEDRHRQRIPQPRLCQKLRERPCVDKALLPLHRPHDIHTRVDALAWTSGTGKLPAPC